jgi:hypothetical protein
VDFTSAAHAVLHVLKAQIGLDMWVVSRRDGEDFVVLAALDDGFGVATSDVVPWSDTYCARMVAGTAPRVVPDVRRAQAWRDADTAMYAEKVTHRARRLGPAPAPVRRPVLVEGPGSAHEAASEPRLDPSSQPEAALDSVDMLLALAREQLGMEVAFLGQFDGDERVIRNAAAVIELPVGPGFRQSREETYCQSHRGRTHGRGHPGRGGRPAARRHAGHPGTGDRRLPRRPRPAQHR